MNFYHDPDSAPTDDLFQGLGVRIKLKKDFLTIKETLTRMGVASHSSKTLYQSCHILHKRGHYAIMHFKEMFILDGKNDHLSDNDITRRNAIADLLEKWGLIEIEVPEYIRENCNPTNGISVIKHADKADWQLVAKYTIGND